MIKTLILFLIETKSSMIKTALQKEFLHYSAWHVNELQLVYII